MATTHKTTRQGRVKRAGARRQRSTKLRGGRFDSRSVVQRISDRMEAMDKSQRDLAQALGIAESAMSRRLSGETAFTLWELGMVATALGVPEDVPWPFVDDDVLALSSAPRVESPAPPPMAAFSAMSSNPGRR